MNKYSYLMKYIIIGDASKFEQQTYLVGVGKSCLLMQFLEGKFKLDSQTTVGVQFGSKSIDLNGDKIKLQIWDTAGQQIFKSITRSYYRGSIGAILVYDISNKNSFKNLEKWIQQTKTYANQKLSIILVGNKNDLEEEREVTYDEGKRFAQQHKMIFIECTAKNTQVTESIFFKLAQQILKKISSSQIDPRNQSLGIKIGTYKGDHALSGRLSQGGGYCC